MRNIYPFILFLLLSPTVQSQIPIPNNAVSLEDALFDESFAKRALPKVTGKLLNLTAAEKKATIIEYTLVTPFSAGQLTKTAKIKSDGSFRLEIDYPFPYQQIWFSVGELFYTGLIVNKDLFVELDMKKIKAAKEVNFNGAGVRYLGTDGALNIYLNNYVLYKSEEQQALNKNISHILDSKKSMQEDILPEYNKVYDEIKKIEENYIVEHPSPYSWILENERQSEYYAQLCPRYWHKVMDENLWEKMRNHKSYMVSNNGSWLYSYMATYIRSLPTNRVMVSWKDVALLPDLTTTEKAYIDSLQAYENKTHKVKLSVVGYEDSSDNRLKWSKQLGSRFMQISMTKRNDKTIHSLDSLFAPAKADFLKLQLNDSKDPNEQKIALAQILASMRTNWTKKVFNAEYTKTLAKIKEINTVIAKSTTAGSIIGIGKSVMTTSFGAKMYEVTNMGAKDFLAKLKDRFRDTAIVLDLWATWCVPCLSEMPHSKKLLLETQNLPVVFVYLCTTNSSDKQKWKTKVAELKQPGLHFFIDDKLDAEIQGLFSFSGYPGYAFIDRDGNYKPGAIQRISHIDKEKLANLLKRN